MRIEWAESLGTGNPVLDRDHEQLVDIINRLELLTDQDHTEIGRVLCDLIDYVISHFGREEQLMLQTHYPGYDPHMLAHGQFFTDLIQFAYAFETGQHSLSTNMHQYLVQWLLNHEATEDKRLALYLSDHQEDQ